MALDECTRGFFRSFSSNTSNLLVFLAWDLGGSKNQLSSEKGEETPAQRKGRKTTIGLTKYNPRVGLLLAQLNGPVEYLSPMLGSAELIRWVSRPKPRCGGAD